MGQRGTFTVSAGTGRAFTVARGRTVRVVNTHGTQVVDTWAFAAPGEYLSLEHCREVRKKLLFDVDDTLVTNLYRPIVTLVADTSPGIHDTLIAACNRRMFELAGHGSDHANCADNLRRALAEHGVEVVTAPSPWNLFMNAPVTDGRAIDYIRPLSRPGDYVELRAEIDCLIAFSACPDDVYPTNGGDGTPADIQIVID